jgi:hypothetical protein
MKDGPALPMSECPSFVLRERISNASSFKPSGLGSEWVNDDFRRRYAAILLSEREG